MAAFDEGVAEVFADDAQQEELETAYEGEDGQHGGPACHGMVFNIADQGVDDEAEAEEGAQGACPEGKTQWFDGLGKDAVYGQVEHLSGRELGDAREAWRRGEVYRGLAEAQAAYKAADEAAVLAELAHGQHRLAVHSSITGHPRAR